MESWNRGIVEGKKGGREGGRGGGVHGPGVSLNSFTFTFRSPSLSLFLFLALVLDFDFDFVRKASAAYTLSAGWLGVGDLWNCIV